MSDVADKKKPIEKKQAAPKAEPRKTAEPDQGIQPRHKIGIVELIMFLLLAAVVFIFIFGMNQMKKEKALEAALQQKFEQVLPTFGVITKAAKEYQANDPFAAWPLSLEELNLPEKIDTPEFKFSFSENGVVILTTTKEFGKEGITVNYDIAKDAYDIQDPDPSVKPTIKEEWLNR